MSYFAKQIPIFSANNSIERGDAPMSLDKISMLENRVSEVLEYIKVLQKEKVELEHKIEEKDTAVKELQQQIEGYKKIEDEFSRVKDERVEVRSRVEKIIDTLKGIGSEE
jgi:seryl-tRNA synthetase